MTQDAAQPEVICADLLERMRSLQLSTVDSDGQPHCGVTPYLHHGESFFVFVSQLSVHTRDMLATKKVAMMIVDDEQNSRQIFARTRVSYQCCVEVVDPDGAELESLLDRYQDRHGKMAGLLRQLPDFRLFRLTPVSGSFVMGFGKAYRLSGKHLDQFEHTRSG